MPYDDMPDNPDGCLGKIVVVGLVAFLIVFGLLLAGCAGTKVKDCSDGSCTPDDTWHYIWWSIQRY